MTLLFSNEFGVWTDQDGVKVVLVEPACRHQNVIWHTKLLAEMLLASNLRPVPSFLLWLVLPF